MALLAMSNLTIFTMGIVRLHQKNGLNRNKKMLKQKKYNDRISFCTALKSSHNCKILFVSFVPKAYNGSVICVNSHRFFLRIKRLNK